ncbi:hypothetical protein V3391_06700 [Luteimonas sp. SMYT11W]|uniref:Uncharacterized protein n=1 Tax=Luteimonas flava TaxID=3115822 RepID=A0ABU7WD78_9GAMM
MSNASPSARSQRRLALIAAPVFAALAVAIVACAPGEAATVTATVVDEAGAPAELVITDRRTCAAVAVYAVPDAVGFDQAAVAARAVFNRFDQIGTVPDCGVTLTRAVAMGIDTDRWQRALDAVDAVDAGTYDIPLACVRAAHVMSAQVAEQGDCVIGGLAFVEARR